LRECESKRITEERVEGWSEELTTLAALKYKPVAAHGDSPCDDDLKAIDVAE
jgi:hypothetical protein